MDVLKTRFDLILPVLIEDWELPYKQENIFLLYFYNMWTLAFLSVCMFDKLRTPEGFVI